MQLSGRIDIDQRRVYMSSSSSSSIMHGAVRVTALFGHAAAWLIPQAEIDGTAWLIPQAEINGTDERTLILPYLPTATTLEIYVYSYTTRKR